MISLTEFSQKILSELEEAGEENIIALMNTFVIDPSNDIEIRTFNDAILELVSLEHITMGLEAFYPRNPAPLSKEEALTLIATLCDWCSFDAAESSWTLSRGNIKTDRFPMVYLTASGEFQARTILAVRGYRWWGHVP